MEIRPSQLWVVAKYGFTLVMNMWVPELLCSHQHYDYPFPIDFICPYTQVPVLEYLRNQMSTLVTPVPISDGIFWDRTIYFTRLIDGLGN